MTALMKRLWNDDGGQGMAEYAIILGVIAAATVAVFATLGTNIGSKITSIAGTIAG